MTVLVTGASGHVGGNLVRALLAKSRPVRCLIHEDTRALEGLPIEQVRGDVRDPESLRSAMRGVETVFHLAAIISVVGGRGGLVEAVNVAGARNAARAAREAGVRRFLHCSSIHAFDHAAAQGAVDERTPRATANHHPAYDRTKAKGEAVVREEIAAGLDGVILHPTAVIGPHDYRPSRVGQVFLDLHRRSLPALIDGGFNWVDVRDVVDGLLAAEQRGRTNESYVLGGHYCSVRELGAVAYEVTGVPPPKLSTPMWLARAAAPFASVYYRLAGGEPLFTSESLRALRTCSPTIDCSKAARDLGYAPRPLSETVEAVYASFAERGVIQWQRPPEGSRPGRSETA